LLIAAPGAEFSGFREPIVPGDVSPGVFFLFVWGWTRFSVVEVRVPLRTVCVFNYLVILVSSGCTISSTDILIFLARPLGFLVDLLTKARGPPVSSTLLSSFELQVLS